MTPTRRVILLGASNLTRSFATVVETVRQTWNEPIDFMLAMGHGRSYGQETTMLGRKISGIFSSALWQDLTSRESLPTSALLTDIGNDLLYDVEVDRLITWIEGCLDHLVDVDATTIVTELPLGSLRRLGEARFRFFRRLLFPRSRLTLADALSRALETNERVRALGARDKTSVISASDTWYGFDPIHLRRRVWREAWPELTSTWRDATARPIMPRATVWNSAYLRFLAPHERTILGVKRGCAQPCGYLSDGSTISLY